MKIINEDLRVTGKIYIGSSGNKSLEDKKGQLTLTNFQVTSDGKHVPGITLPICNSGINHWPTESGINRIYIDQATELPYRQKADGSLVELAEGSTGLVVAPSTAIGIDGPTGLVYQELAVPITSTEKVSGGKPPSFDSFKSGLYEYAFAETEEVFFTVPIPSSYAEGEDLTVSVRYSLKTLTTSDQYVKLTMEYSIANTDSVFPGSSTVSKEFSVQNDPALTHTKEELGIISGTGLQIGAVLVCRFERSASSGTTYGDDVYVHSVCIGVPVNAMGSRSVGSK